MTEIIGFHITDQGTLTCSKGIAPCTSPPYLEYILQHSGYINLFADLDKDVARLLKLLDLTPYELQGFHITEKLSIPPYTLTYYPGKFFSIDRGSGAQHPYANFCDAGQYQLCNSASEAQHVGVQVYNVLESLGIQPTSLISPANAFRKHFYDTGDIQLPNFNQIPEEAMEAAYNCCRGSWIETFQRGYWPKVYDYDLRSAYPYEASKLLSFNKGNWVQSNTYMTQAFYGYCYCNVQIDSQFSPIAYESSGEMYTPKGTWETWLTKGEIDFIELDLKGKVEILNGWWWMLPEDSLPPYPLNAVVHWLYGVKEQSEGIKLEVIKRIMAGSFYGLFLENRNNELGDYFCSPWAAEIEASTRLRMARTCIHHDILPISVAVDGIVVDQPLPITGTHLGDWRLSHTGKCLSLRTGIVAIGGKDGGGDFGIGYDKIKDLIESNPKATSWTMGGTGVVTLAKAVAGDRYEDLGEIDNTRRTIGLEEFKRDYATEPRSGGSLLKYKYRSRPWGVNVLKVLETKGEGL